MKSHSVAAALALITFCLTSYFSLMVFREYPFTHDEYVNKYQAEIFAGGRMAIPVNPNLSPLLEVFILEYDGHIFSKYPPGFSALLAIGVKLGAPGLVNPLISTISILFIFATLLRLTSFFAAACVAFLLSVNSYFLGYGGSYFAQSLTLCLAAAGFYFFRLYELKPRRATLAAMAAAVGLCFLVRPLDAACLLVTFLAGLFFTPGAKRLREMAAFTTISACGVAVLLYYNYLQAGCLCLATYPVWDSEFKVYDPAAQDFMENLQLVAGQYIDSIPAYFSLNFSSKLVPIIGAPFLLAALFGACFSPLRQASRLRLLGAIFMAGIVVLYNFHHNEGIFVENSGWPQYGTRYWYPLIVPLSIFAAYGIAALYRTLPRWLFAALLLLTVALQGERIHSDMRDYAQRFNDIKRINDIIAAQCPLHSIIVLFPKDWFFYLDKNEYITLDDFKRNAFFSGPRFFVSTPQDALDIGPYFPHYRICNYSVPQNIMAGWHAK